MLGSVALSAALALQSCSTTSHLPEGEQLYTGVKSITVTAHDSIEAELRDEVSAILEVEPNSSLFGSAYRQSPFPIGLWVYNGLYTDRESGLRHWLWNHFKSDPTLISQVNPLLRCQAVEVALHDEGFFGSNVEYSLVESHSNPNKASISYAVNYGRRSHLSDVSYMPTVDARVDSIVHHSSANSLLRQGKHFSANDLEAERTRIASVLVDSGYFYYRPEFVRYLADSTQAAGEVALRVITDFEADSLSLQPCRIDSTVIRLDYGYTMPPTDFLSSHGTTIAWRGPLAVKPVCLYDCVNFHPGRIYDANLGKRIVSRLSRLNTFKYNSIDFEPLFSLNDTIHMLMRVNSTYDAPWVGTLEVKAAYKDNKQVGPGLAFVGQRRNLWGGGEMLRMEVNGGYEWNTGRSTIGERDGLLNSFEVGGRISVSVPRLQLPLHFDRNYPVTTTYGISADIMRRSGFFQMLRSSVEFSYSFSSDRYSTHVITPLQLAYTSLISKTEKFDNIVSGNRVLRQSFANQFIPSIRYTYLFDNSSDAGNRTHQWMQFSLAEAGGLLDVLMGSIGKHRPQGDRQLLWQRFSQFVRVACDVRNYISLGHRHELATRLYGGIAYAYGNSSTIPYSEQFYIGGANSLRGFSIRGIGPGQFNPGGSKYAYMDRTGDVKIEANVEWRFPVSGGLNAALFADAGNIWTLRNDEGRPGGQIDETFFEQLATDVGVGLRYDFGMCLLRFDVGVPLHDPALANDGYYNQRGSFFGNLGYHLAVGYPF